MAKNDFMQNSSSVSTAQLVDFGFWIAMLILGYNAWTWKVKKISVKPLLLSWKLDVQIETIDFHSSYILPYESKGVGINVGKNYTQAVSVLSSESQLFMCFSGVVPFLLKFM